MQERVERILADNPGSTQSGWNEVTMIGGDPILTLAVSPEVGVTPYTTVADCSAGAFCAYSGVGYRGDRLIYRTCTNNHSVAGLTAVRSIANSRTVETVRAYNGATLNATVPPGTGKNVTGTVTKLTCS